MAASSAAKQRRHIAIIRHTSALTGEGSWLQELMNGHEDHIKLELGMRAVSQGWPSIRKKDQGSIFFSIALGGDYLTT